MVHLARGSVEMQDPKNRQKFAISAPSQNFVGLYLRNEGTYRQSETKLFKQQCLPHKSSQYGAVGEFGAPQLISTGFASWQRYCTTLSSGRQPNFAAFNRGRHLYSVGRSSRWVLAHILVIPDFVSFSVLVATTGHLLLFIFK